jgi:outer membrane immunogenic protein
MRITLITGAALAMVAASQMAGQALAADIVPTAPAYKAPPAVVVASRYDWTGFYIGGNLGYGWGHATTDVTAPNLTTSVSESLNGVIGGGQLGYRRQFGSWVLGFETDIQWSGQSAGGTVTCPAATCGTAVTVTHDDKISWFGTTRSKLGYAFDTWMIYFTSGVAYGEIKTDLTATTATGIATTSGSKTGFAWTVGGGAEFALSQNWSTKIEYLWIDTKNVDNTATVPGYGTVNSTSRVTNNIVRAGLNYRF